jgi:hypothetical protein
MPHLVQHLDFVSLCALAGGAAALGLAGLLAPLYRVGRTWRGPLALAAALGLWGVIALAAGCSRPFWLAPLALGSLAALAALARLPLLPASARACVAALGHARLQAAALLVAGAGLLGWQVYQIEHEDHEDFLAQFEGPSAFLTLEEPGLLARTDAGHPVPLCSARRAEDGPLEEGEARMIHQRNLHRRVIQTASADLTSNCHGWVFAAGRHWVRGSSIERILLDNGYQAVSRPEPGDLAVWRDESGSVTHSGLVRSSADDGTVLIESKWGMAGRFIHTPTAHAYATHNCTYYHSGRGTHLLRGMGEASAPAGGVARGK